MPRTKQVHPKNLRDKIEEAQKELNNPEEQSKGTEIAEAGIRGALDTVKGVKRKKVVTGNYMKKIPKSPLRNPSRTNLRHCIKEFSSPYSPANASECSNNLNKLPVQNGEQYADQNGRACKTELTVETVKPGAPVQTREVLLVHQSLKFCKGKSRNCDARSRMTLQEDKCVSSALSNKSRSDSDGIFDSTSSPCTSTAFDVLLKVMEPELNILTEKCPPCGAKVEKQRPNETLGPSSSCISSTKSAPNHASLSQQEISVGLQYYPCTAHNVQVSMLARSEKAHSHSVCHSYSHQKQSISRTGHHNQPLALGPSIRSGVHQQYPDTSKPQQIYNICMTSSVVHTSPSNLTQVLPQNQLTVNTSPAVSISSTNTTHLPPVPTYNITHVASLINQGGEQMCNLLKDPRPKKQGKYICEYCNRACAKPSVLLKHIRSHTGERPYPCVTCGFSFKTKSNLYKHKKSHAHAIKLGLVLRPHSGDQESEKSLCIHCDEDESGESDDEYTGEERQDDQSFLELETMKPLRISSHSEAVLQKPSSICSENLDGTICDTSLQETCSELTMSTFPQVVVCPVNVSPLRDGSPKVIDSASEHDIVQKHGNFQTLNEKSNLTSMTSLKEADLKCHQKEEMKQLKEKQGDHVVTIHAQLQRQQATDCPQDQQGKYLLSPRSLGSTDSGYFSRSESAEQTLCQPIPFVKVLSICEKDFSKNTVSVSQTNTAVASVVHTICAEKPLIPSGIMRPPLRTKTLEERISKLISDNEAVVDDKQLDSVKPRRISLSRRGSIDSPKSYIFKDSFQFDLKPVGRRTSSSSDIPKSPFTPTDKSKQVFLLSVPSLECLPITRSNSMPTTGCSVVPTNTIPPHPLRESQSFDDKIGSFYDDVFVSTPTTSIQQVGHPRTLVRQTAIEDSSSNDRHVLGSVHSVDENYHGGNIFTDISLPRSKSFAQGSEKMKRLHQGRGTMFECETCRNRYRKLENFENHKKFYCSELHGPKSKAAVREPDHNVVLNSTHPQVLHYRVAGSTGVLEQPPQIRKRRKMKSVGDDDEPQQNENSTSLENMVGAHVQNILRSAANSSRHSVSKLNSQRSSGIPLQSSQVELVSRGAEYNTELKLSPALEKANSVAQEKEMKRQGTGISVIQHTNSLSRPSSFEKLESFERGSPVSFQDILKTSKQQSFNTVGLIQEEGGSQCSSQYKQPMPTEEPQLELQESQIVVSNERSAPVHQSRLVRQHNIQVPEILVTEEPDKDSENQGNDHEIAEKFNWPQRSESLSNLPTEKLPPKKKRIRLAEIELSSAESSFDSTTSRGFSVESSLSRTSSISASFDKDDISKTEGISKIDSIMKSSEFLRIPTSSNSLGMPREMRRAASEQINCTHSSTEVADCRSKSLDCGSMSPTDCMSSFEVLIPKSTLCTEISGHVPLLERRRRGPFVRQISLNIVPESNPPQIKSAYLFQNTVLPDLSSMPFHKLKTSCRSSDGLPSSSQHSSIYANNLLESQLVIHTSNSSSIEQTSGSDLGSLCQPPPLHFSSKTLAKILTEGQEEDKSSITSKNENCFAPKYQLQVKTHPTSQLCSSNQLTTTLSNRTLTGQANMEQNIISLNTPMQLVDNVSGLQKDPQSKKVLHNNASDQMQQTPVMVPVHTYSHTTAYGFADVKALPQILVTQELVNLPVSKVNNALMSMPNDKAQIQKSNNETNWAIPNSKKAVVCEKLFPEIENRTSEPLDFIQKMPVGGLLPQQEATASSKRMLSPANSLDIAMEKHQKRVKDESGAEHSSDVQEAHLLNIKAGETNKQKKHILVRQLCTTEPTENLDQEIASEYGKPIKMTSLVNVFQSGILSSEGFKPAVPESIEEASEFENTKAFASSNSTAGKSPEPLSLNSQTSLLKASSNNQEQKSPVFANLNKQINIQGHSKLGPTLSVVNAGDMYRLSFPSLKTSTSFTWCYLLKRRPLHTLQSDQKISAYSAWTVSPTYPNPDGLPTKVALSLLNSKQKDENLLYTHAISTRSRCDILVYSSKWKHNTNKLLVNQKSTVKGVIDKENSETNTEQGKDNLLTKNEPRRVKIFDGGYKSNEDYVYVRGRGRGKYICEECGIRCKKPSMLKKHIRTHTDVRPYHCNYCNFSFKTKGNLTKHMKSKAHSKKCVDMGVSVGSIDEQDAEESGERQKYSCERAGYDVDDSDGADDDDNEDEDEDSQAESGLSATPSVTASPQHHPDRSSHHDTSNASEETRMPDCFPRGQAGLVNILPKALITKMTALTTASDFRTARSPVAGRHQETNGNSMLQHVTNVDCTQSSPASTKSPSYQMSVDNPDTEEALEDSTISETTVLTKDSSVKLPPPPVDRSTQTTVAPDYNIHQQKMLEAAELAASQTHLFSHLPLHSQQPARTPYSMIPVGGVQLVPAYSTFVPIQAGPVHLTIPAVGVIHRSTGALGDNVSEISSTTNPIGIAEVNNVVPCIPVGQVNVPGLPSLNAPSLQPLPSLSMETLNILGLTNTNVAPQIHPSGLTLNAVGLQVLTASPSPQSNPIPQTHIPGLQILNIALPTLIPSISPLSADAQGKKTCQTRSEPIGHSNQTNRTGSPQIAPPLQEYTGKKISHPATLHEYKSLNAQDKADIEVVDAVNHMNPQSNIISILSKAMSTPEVFTKMNCGNTADSLIHKTRPAETQVQRLGLPRRQNTVQFSDASSDDDEDRLVIAT